MKYKFELPELTAEQKASLAVWIQLIIMVWYVIHCIRKEFSVDQTMQAQQKETLAKQKARLNEEVFQGKLKCLKQENRIRLLKLKKKAKNL